MPVVPDQYDSMGALHPVFEMNLPEGQLRHRLELMFSKVVRDFDQLALLQIIGKSQIGRLRYAAEGTVLEDVPTHSVEALLAYRGAEDLFDDLLERFATYSGISGLQPKILLRNETGAFDRVTGKGATHIVKSFNPTEYPELAANEFFSMRAAGHAKIPTATASLSANRKMLVVERFDRTSSGHYLGFEDFCVLSGLRAGGRYHSSYEDLAGKVGLYVSPEHYASSMEQFFAMVALAFTIGNADAHLKNFGILYDAPGVNVHLAPVYDMLSTRPYHDLTDVPALEFDGAKAFPSRIQLIRFGRTACGLTAQRVDVILSQVAGGVRKAVEEMRAYTHANPDFESAASVFVGIFENGLLHLDSDTP
jgi:serine/threonine-protein kinase HipA